MKKWLSTLMYSVFIFEPVSAQIPIIDNVSGSVSDGQQITITGSNFGANGPDVILFDDFKRGIEGEDITLTAPLGNWNVPQHQPTYGKDTQGNIAGRFIGDGGGRLIFTFSDVQEIFISYRVMIPGGKHFPHSFAPNTFPSGSQWKLTWLMDGDRGAAGNDDLVIPTWGNGTYFSIAGNDNAYQLATGRASGDTRWFSFQDWNRYSVYMKGGATPDVDPGTVWSQGMSEEFGQKIFGSSDRRLFDGDDTADGYQFEDDAISRWNKLNVPGWHRGGDDNAAAMYDDIYIATGAHARARIEIGNNAIYENSTVLAIATPASWQDNAITTTVRQGTFQVGETAYLFVIDENGNVSTGYPFTFRPASKIQNDFNGDGKSDIFWRHDLSNNNKIYLMNSSSVSSEANVSITTTAAAGWEAVGSGDFNDDARTDILWRHSGAGQNHISLMNGTATPSGVDLNIPALADTQWKIAGVGDFDDDGNNDIFWHHDGGENRITFMNGTGETSTVTVNTISDTNWKVAGIADLNNDGKDDVLWRNNINRRVWLYLMNGSNISNGSGAGEHVAFTSDSWDIEGVGDFDNNGRGDILWRHNTNGRVWMYLMNGPAVSNGNTVAPGEHVAFTGLDWEINAIGDYNGDGKQDIFWRNNTYGWNHLYLMNGATLSPAGGIGVNTLSDLNWKVRRR